MSGALVYLASKGAQDVYIADSFIKKNNIMKYSRFKNFAEFPEQFIFNNDVRNNTTSIIKVNRSGDLLTQIWLEGTNILNQLQGTTFKLMLGGQEIDVQTYEYMADIWQIYMAENNSKSKIINNKVSVSDPNFFPLHFFFCDNAMFLPLIALQYYQVELQIHWGSGNIESVNDLKVYGNYILLDHQERNYLAKNKLEFLITQVQRLPFSTESSDTGSNSKLNLRSLNHPVKAIFVGFEAGSSSTNIDYWTFDSASLTLNESFVFEQMSPSFLHTIQGYYYTNNGVLSFDPTTKSPNYTRFYMYSFGNKIDTYSTSGTCNFSRINQSFLILNNITNVTSKTLNVYAVNYNILRIQDGMGGLLFSN